MPSLGKIEEFDPSSTNINRYYNNNKDILTGSPHHKKVVFSGALHKIRNKYDKNDLKVKVKNRGCKKLKLKKINTRNFNFIIIMNVFKTIKIKIPVNQAI